MKLTFLGTCSGTEPMPGRRHVCVTVEAGGGVYVFDAGEGCGWAAHVAGVDMLAVRAVFISHGHFDHTAGLPGLLWVMQRLAGLWRRGPHGLTGATIPLLLPRMDIWTGLLDLIDTDIDTFTPGYTIDPRRLVEGEVFADDVIRVLAAGNAHMGPPAEDGLPRSFSFRIEAAARSVVYSGDVADVSELAPLVGDGCDVIVMETGHHLVEKVCGFLRDSHWRFGRLVFNHHGRAVLADPAGELRKARSILGENVIITDEGMTLKV